MRSFRIPSTFFGAFILLLITSLISAQGVDNNNNNDAKYEMQILPINSVCQIVNLMNAPDTTLYVCVYNLFEYPLD